MESKIKAGVLSVWLNETRHGQEEARGVDVPCGDCTACCTSSYFIHIKASEKETLKHIPKELLFPAPGLAKGNVLLGYDQDGKCPMLIDSQCSIYQHRPLTCRSYDCRVFPATGISLDEPGKELIRHQSERWEFDATMPGDGQVLLALRTAASFIRKHIHRFPEGVIPQNPTQQAMVAINIHEVFLGDQMKNPHSDAAVEVWVEIITKLLKPIKHD